MEEIRKMTGICPQHDVLFDELSPREHLQFFARIRVRLVICFHGSDIFAPPFCRLVDPKCFFLESESYFSYYFGSGSYFGSCTNFSNICKR
jgi:hypothetical protein